MTDRVPLEDLLWDGYNECYWTPEQVKNLLQQYHQWCKRKKQVPGVMSIEFVDENIIGHVAYHADLQHEWEIHSS